jgi:hypothetical protein
MPRVSNRHLRALEPFFEGGLREDSEQYMHCPLHEDKKRSASLNVLTGAWYCQSCGHGGGVVDLIRRRSQWVKPGVAARNGHAPRARTSSVQREIITEEQIEWWHETLLNNEPIADYLVTERGIHTKTLAQFKIGWDPGRDVYTIPIFGPKGDIWNVRRYDPNPADDDSKIKNVYGMRSAELYPFTQLEAERIIICEGEWDAIITIQNGYATVTRTASARTWKGDWNKFFKGKTVFLCHDRDAAGRDADEKVARALQKFADVRIVDLPYEYEEKHGKDLSDYWQEYDRADFERLLAEARPYRQSKVKEPDVITVLDSFDSQNVSEPVKLQVTIKGKKEPGYSIPRKATLTCTRDAGAKCQICPLNPAGGKAEVEIMSTNPAILGLIDAPENVILDQIRETYGALKCNKLEIEVTEHQAVEILFARPSIDHADGSRAKDYKNIKITSAGRYDTSPNNTVLVTGALYPSPRDARNEFLAWDVTRQETSVDKFVVNPETIRLMERFRPRKGQRPLKKLSEISRDLSAHVTRIIGRPEMHALIDLTFHSVLSFKFGGKLEHRGWLESLVVGDTRTGKSEAAERLVRHYGAGEIVGGEAATIAGLVGGLQQIGGKDWAVTWGVIPLNDRRIVVIDELSGLHTEEISKMSDIRASGVARLTKIQQEVTFARTRLLWLGNPRHGSMDQFTYGVDALRPLIGNPEDIARFDLAMAVTKYDVPPAEYNKRLDTGELRYTADACHTMLMWCWTRQPEQIVWARGAEEAVYKQAMELGSRYTEDPPLVQAANIRIKLARVAAALAARTFSTDETHEKLIITTEHVADAAIFIDMLYKMPSFGYEERSRERIEDTEEAIEHRDEIRKFLLERRGLAKFLRSNSSFRRQDLEEILNIDREGANAIINKLWEARMVRKETADIRVEPTLHGLLREVKW